MKKIPLFLVISMLVTVSSAVAAENAPVRPTYDYDF